MTLSSVAKYLKISRSEVSLWINRFKETGNVDDLSKSGRPRATSAKENAYIVKMAEYNEDIRSEQILESMRKKQVNISSITLRRLLNESSLYHGYKTKKLY